MELNAPLLSLPAFVALLVKGGIYVFAHYSRQHSVLTRLYLLFLFALSVQNLAEISHFFVWAGGTVPDLQLRLYYACAIVALAFVFHFALAVANDRFRHHWRGTVGPVYAAAAGLVVLVFQGDALIRGFAPFGYSLTRIPGPWYFLFEVFAIGIILGVLGSLVYGLFRQVTPRKRARCAMVLLAIAPMALLVGAVVVSLHFGGRSFNATFINPFAITIFLFITAYATHRHRLFDIQFYLPGSRLRREKRAFYTGLQRLLADLPRLKTPQQALGRLVDQLGCGAALLTRNGVIASGAYGGAPPPPELLPQIDGMLVTEELEDQQPETYAELTRRGIGAIVPFCPHCRRLPAWLVLDSRFGETVYMPQDFQATQPLFKRLGAFILDRLVEDQGGGPPPADTLQRRLERLVEENHKLRGINAALVRERPLDSLGPLHVADGRDDTTPVAVIGGCGLRDALAQHYARVTAYDGLGAFLDAGAAPALIVWQADRPQDAGAVTALLGRVAGQREAVALLAVGEAAGGMLSAQWETVRGALVERLPRADPADAVLRRSRALLRLQQASFDLQLGECPLVGASQIYRDFMETVAEAARRPGPVLLRGDDRCQMVAVARHLHRLSGAPGEFEVLNSRLDMTGPADTGLLARCSGGTVLVDNLLTLPLGLQHVLLHTLDHMGEAAPRLMACCLLPPQLRLEQVAVLPSLLERCRDNLLEIPRLVERRTDLPLLFHYFTLQHNLPGGGDRWLNPEDMAPARLGWLEEATLMDLRKYCFERLQDRHRHRPRA